MKKNNPCKSKYPKDIAAGRGMENRPHPLVFKPIRMLRVQANSANQRAAFSDAVSGGQLIDFCQWQKFSGPTGEVVDGVGGSFQELQVK